MRDDARLLVTGLVQLMTYCKHDLKFRLEMFFAEKYLTKKNNKIYYGLFLLSLGQVKC